MTIDELEEEILRQRELQKEYFKRLRLLEQQKARFGDLHVPPHIQVEIEEINENIQRSERVITACESLKQEQRSSLELLRRREIGHREGKSSRINDDAEKTSIHIQKTNSTLFVFVFLLVFFGWPIAFASGVASSSWIIGMVAGFGLGCIVSLLITWFLIK